MVRQIWHDSCVAACGEYLTRGHFNQKHLIAEIGKPAALKPLAKVLGSEWTGGEVDKKHFDALVQSGEWLATLREEFIGDTDLAHAVIVEGLTPGGRVSILDPWHATRYEMIKEDFLDSWDLGVVFRRNR